MNLRYRVELSQAERDELKALLSGGKRAVRKVKRAQILLAADAGASDEEIVTSIGVGGSTVYRTKRRFVLGNLELALREEPRPGAERKLSGKRRAHGQVQEHEDRRFRRPSMSWVWLPDRNREHKRITEKELAQQLYYSRCTTAQPGEGCHRRVIEVRFVPQYRLACGSPLARNH